MWDLNAIRREIFALQSPEAFDELALRIFYYQREQNPIYRQYLELLGKESSIVKQADQIPCLPVELFRGHRVITGECIPELSFSSSGTTGSVPSRHYVCDPGIYRQSFTKGFELRYGPVDSWCFIALLPAYTDRPDSSLVYMMQELIRLSGDPDSGFYLNELDGLPRLLRSLQEKGKKVLLIGVSFALMDLAERFPGDYSGITFMETGGMKGRRKELTREELHEMLTSAFKVSVIHSEYGMTELLSQAYSLGGGRFECPPWMKVYTREADDPLSRAVQGRTGGLDIVDLANLHSCAFISIQDLGKVHDNGSFEVLGRFDHSEVRGCNLMLSL